MDGYKPTQYELTAVAAATLAAHGMYPAAAWDITAKEVCGSLSTAEKRCPRSAFLGLASAGVISGVTPGEYCASSKNAKYALEALELLCIDHKLATQPLELWRRVMKGQDKKYNQQMHVVAALWRAKKFVIQGGTNKHDTQS